MKRLLIVFLGLTAHTLVHAQSRGSLMLGGSIGYQKSKQTVNNAFSSYDQEATSLTAQPRLAYFVSNRLAVGAEVGIQNTRQELSPTTQPLYRSKARNNTIAAGVFVRPYWNIGKNFSVFAHGGVNYLSFKAKSQFNSDPEVETGKGDGFSVSIYPGINYTFHRRLMFEIGLQDLLFFSSTNSKGYTTSPSTNNSDNSLTQISLGGNMGISAGIHVLIGK